MVGVLLRGNTQVEDVVCGVTGGHQDTFTLGGLVDWAVVGLDGDEVFGLAGFEPDEGAFRVEDLGFGLDERVLFVVPSAAFDVHACYNDSILGLRWIWISEHLEVIIKQVNSNVVFSCIVLLCSSNESLREVESSDPKDVWR